MGMLMAFGLSEVKAEPPIEGTASPIKVGDATTSSRLTIDNNFVDPSHNCERCTKLVYTPGPQREAGLAYKDDKLNLDNSHRIVFFARGQSDLRVSFVAVGNDTQLSSKNDTDIFPKINFSVVTDNVSLTNDWRRFEIGLNGTALSDASYPFGIQLAADSSQKQIFYIKGITLDNKPAKNPLPTVHDSLNSTSDNSTEPMTALINSNSTNSSAPATIEFRANSTGGLAPYSFTWNFDDDNSTSTDQNVLHTFHNAGLYNITLGAKDSSTPSQNKFVNTLVTITAPANRTTNSSLNATGLNSLNATGLNSFNATGTSNVNANDTSNVNANDTSNVNANDTSNDTSSVNPASTRSIVSTKVPEANGTFRNASGALPNHLGDSAASKSETNKTDQFAIMNEKNVTLKASKVPVPDVDSNNHIPVALDQTVTLNGNKAVGIDLRGSDEDNDRIKFELADRKSVV